MWVHEVLFVQGFAVAALGVVHWEPGAMVYGAASMAWARRARLWMKDEPEPVDDISYLVSESTRRLRAEFLEHGTAQRLWAWEDAMDRDLGLIPEAVVIDGRVVTFRYGAPAEYKPKPKSPPQRHRGYNRPVRRQASVLRDKPAVSWDERHWERVEEGIAQGKEPNWHGWGPGREQGEDVCRRCGCVRQLVRYLFLLPPSVGPDWALLCTKCADRLKDLEEHRHQSETRA